MFLDVIYANVTNLFGNKYGITIDLATRTITKMMPFPLDYVRKMNTSVASMAAVIMERNVLLQWP